MQQCQEHLFYWTRTNNNQVIGKRIFHSSINDDSSREPQHKQWCSSSLTRRRQTLLVSTTTSSSSSKNHYVQVLWCSSAGVLEQMLLSEEGKVHAGQGRALIKWSGFTCSALIKWSGFACRLECWWSSGTDIAFEKKTKYTGWYLNTIYTSSLRALYTVQEEGNLHSLDTILQCRYSASIWVYQ